MTRTWGGVTEAPLRPLVSNASSSAFLLCGYDQGIFAGLLGGSGFIDTFNNPCASVLGTVTAIYEIGCFFGAVFIFAVAKYLGRKNAIWLGLAIMLVGTVLQASSCTIAQLVVGRIVTGFGNGINTSTVPMYQAETTKVRSRGRMISLEGWFITIGIVISYWIIYGTASSPNASIQFRTPIVLQAVFGIITIIMLFEDSIEVQKQYAVIEAALAVEQTGTIHLKEYFAGGQKQTFRRLLLGYSIQMLQQLTGINAVIFYSSYLLQITLSIERNLSLVVGGCTELAFFVFTFIPILFIDEWCRRVPLMLGAAGQAIAMLIIAITVKLSLDGNKKAGVTAIVFVMVYIAVYSGFGWVAGPWLYPTEINQLRFRSKGTALATQANWMWNFVVFFFIWMCFNAAFVPIIYLVYPETAGKTLEELDLLISHTTKGYKLTEKGSRLGKGGEEEAQVFAVLRRMRTADGRMPSTAARRN